LKNSRTRIQKFWNRSGIGVWKSDSDHLWLELLFFSTICSLAPLLFGTSVIWHLCYVAPLLFGGVDDEPVSSLDQKLSSGSSFPRVIFTFHISHDRTRLNLHDLTMHRSRAHGDVK